MAEIQETPKRILEPLLKDDRETDFPLTTPLPTPHHGRRRGLVIILTILVVIVLIGTGGAAYFLMHRQPGVQYIQTAARQGNLTLTTSSTGPIAPKSEVDLNFQTSGQISSIKVQLGQQVKQGQTLATLNATMLQDSVNQAQQKLNAAQQAFNDASALGVNQTTLDQDQQQIDAAQLALTAAQHQLGEATLTAPSAGTVAEINGIVGDSAGSGSGSSSSSGSSSAFIVLVDSSGLTITANVDEADIVQVQKGQAATFTVAAYPKNTFRATVTSVGSIGSTSSNVVNYPVELSVDMSSLQNTHLYTDMTATVNIVTQSATNVLLIPATALTFYTQALANNEISRSDLTGSLRSSLRGRQGFSGAQGTRGTQSTPGTQGTQGTQSAASTRGIVLELVNGKLTPVLVTIGLSNGQFTEVLSGLKAGDEVVTSQTGGTTTTSSTTTAGGGLGGLGGGGFGGGGFGGGGGTGGGRRNGGGTSNGQ